MFRNYIRSVSVALCFSGAAIYGQNALTLPDYVPETSAERWRIYTHDSFLGPSPYLRALVPAAFQQLRGRPEEWPQGMGGYARRVGVHLALLEMQEAFYHGGAAAIGEDTRYERCACTETWRRVGHALARTFVTRNRSGAIVPRTAFFSAYTGRALIATAWYPDSERGWSRQTAAVGVHLGFSALGRIGQEFSPEIRKMLHRK